MGAVLHEVPLPPPEKPEREHTRSPDYERASITVGAAGSWVGDVHRAVRELAERTGADVGLTVELADGRRLEAHDLRAGPGDGFVTVCLDGRELALRLDRILGLELGPAGETPFRVRDAGFGFER